MDNGVMLAYLPTNTDWCKQDLAHMTLVYCGTTDTLKPPNDQNALAKDALSVAGMTGSFALAVTGIQQLGEAGQEVDALILYPTPQLLVARQLVQRWNGSQYTDWLPHVTIGPVGSANSSTSAGSANATNSFDTDDGIESMLPTILYFDRLLLAWGDKQMIFPLRQYN